VLVQILTLVSQEHSLNSISDAKTIHLKFPRRLFCVGALELRTDVV